jgi:hypothetical protein
MSSHIDMVCNMYLTADHCKIKTIITLGAIVSQSCKCTYENSAWSQAFLHKQWAFPWEVGLVTHVLALCEKLVYGEESLSCGLMLCLSWAIASLFNPGQLRSQRSSQCFCSAQG